MFEHLLHHFKIVIGGLLLYKITPEQFASFSAGTYSLVAAAYTIWKWCQDAKGRKDGK